MTTKNLYNKNAEKWERNEPVSLSDYTGRMPVLDLCGNIKGKDVLDLGCGEGYMARQLIDGEPTSIKGVDLSPEMISRAKVQNIHSNVSFQTGNVTSIPFEDNSFDLVICVFVYNYVTTKEMLESFKEVKRVLKSPGKFIFSVPHPFFPFLQNKAETFHFDFGKESYFSARGMMVDGVIKRRDGIELPVQMSHRIISDYLDCLRSAGFTTMPTMLELTATDEHLKIDTDFFEPVHNKPLHIAISIGI